MAAALHSNRALRTLELRDISRVGGLRGQSQRQSLLKEIRAEDDAGQLSKRALSKRAEARKSNRFASEGGNMRGNYIANPARGERPENLRRGEPGRGLRFLVGAAGPRGGSGARARRRPGAR